MKPGMPKRELEQGWTDVDLQYFANLTIVSEQILFSIRYVSWNYESDPVQTGN